MTFNVMPKRANWSAVAIVCKYGLLCPFVDDLSYRKYGRNLMFMTCKEVKPQQTLPSATPAVHFLVQDLAISRAS